jgi:hypothetical protein
MKLLQLLECHPGLRILPQGRLASRQKSGSISTAKKRMIQPKKGMVSNRPGKVKKFSGRVLRFQNFHFRYG